MPPSGEINENAQTGFAKSAAYDQHRPSYTPSIVQLLLEKVRVSGKNGAKILDLAAGTGKFTEALAARDEKYQIIAVEPHPQMRAVLADKKLPGVTVEDGKADSIPLEDGSIDAVICAQAFHWFANMESLREIHRVLQRHGVLGMVWNIDDFNGPKGHKTVTTWEAKAHELLWTFEDNTPRYRHQKWRQVFEEQSKSSPLPLIFASDQLFSLPLGEQDEKFAAWLSKEEAWERFNTFSYIARLEGEERERTHQTFMDAVNAADVETDKNGRIALHGTTTAVWTSKIPADGASLTDVEIPSP